MILQLFIFGFLFMGFGIFNFIKKKKILGIMFVLLGIVALLVGVIVVSIYPHTIPFDI